MFQYRIPTIVAEIGCTHVGQMDRAKKLIELAHESGADYVKLQKRNPTESTPVYLHDQPHPNQLFAYGNTYLEHRQNLELSIDQHRELKDYCERIGTKYATSVWDITSAREIISLNPDFIKIPSPCNEKRDLLRFVFDNFAGSVHLSLGMIDRKVKSDLISFIYPWRDRVVLYHCTSEYPCPSEHLYLLDILELCQLGCQAVGYSCHAYGIASDVAAYVLGAEWIERHFIDDRCFRHTDAAASLEPGGLQKLCRDLRAVHNALAHKYDITAEEAIQKKKLKN